MYKDKDKQREANRKASQRRRDKVGGMTQGMTVSSSDIRVIPKPSDDDLLLSKVLCKPDVGEDFTTEGVTVIDERSNEPSNVKPKCGAVPINRTPYAELKGDKIVTLKRGKDIKCFEDLPPDVQQTIDIMSRRDGKIDLIDKARRTKIAIHYRTTCFGYQGTGVA